MDERIQDYIQKTREMWSTGKKLICYASRKNSLFRKGIHSKLNSSSQSPKKCKISYKKRCRVKTRSHSKRRGAMNSILSGKPKLTLQTISNLSLAKCQSSPKLLVKKASTMQEKWKNADGNGASGIMRKRKRRRKEKNNAIQDEASRLQRRARYLLIKMKQEQNLIDAYSGDGWKGQSREKLKPEMELLRAGKQILKCKLGIREVIHQLDLLNYEGGREDFGVDADGSDFHNLLFCAKCNSGEDFLDNDYILCDGKCNGHFHQKCVEPALGKPPTGDQGWLCKFCECKMEVLKLINAHLGTCFTVNSGLEDIFKEATNPDCEVAYRNPSGDWPSEDSEDEDYYPEKINNDGSRTISEDSDSDGACTSISLCFLADEVSNDFDETSDPETTSQRRQRKDVDYKKLHDEIFGKDLAENEQSEDEDWGPCRRKWRTESDGDTAAIIATCANEDGCSNREIKERLCDRRPVFRISADAVMKLRQVFAENELPSRSTKENLSKQLGIASDKVGRWFRNARYAALKSKKAQISTELYMNNINEGDVKDVAKHSCDMVPLDNTYLLPLSSLFCIPRKLKRSRRRKNRASLPTTPSEHHKSTAISLLDEKVQEPNKLRSSVLENQLPFVTARQKFSKELAPLQVSPWFTNAALFNNTGLGSKPCLPQVSFMNQVTAVQELYLAKMERLCRVQERLQRLQKVLLACQDDGSLSDRSISGEQTMFVPVAELKQKAPNKPMV